MAQQGTRVPRRPTERGPGRAGRATGLLARVRALVARVQRTRVGRALARYGVARGGLLAGGIAYSALFSIAAALTIAYTAFMAVLGGHAALRQTVLDAVDAALPGIIDDGSGGLLKPDALLLDTALNPGSVLAGAILLWTALSVMAGLKNSIRAMFGIVAPPENPLTGRARDLAGFLALALGVLASAVLGLVGGTLAEQALAFLGVEGAVAGWFVRALGLGTALAVDWAVLVMLFRVTAGARPLRKDLFLGALLGAVASGVLRQLGTSAVGAVDNPLLASFAAIATLLLWVNLLARVVLMVAAWTANPPAPARPGAAEEVHLGERPNFVTMSDPATLEWRYQPITGAISPDETLNPHYEPEPAPPVWGGLRGRYHRRRIARLERRLDRARERYAAGARRT
ncbi:MAG: YihY/virulence factor BrkB family protein [Georgenia sp.]